MSLRVAEIAARHGQPDALAEELTQYLRTELRAQAVALYWCKHSQRRRHGGVSTVLRPAGTASAPASARSGDQSAHQLKASGYRALSAGKLLVRLPATFSDQSAGASPLIIAMPLGTNDPWAVLVSAWDTTATDSANHRADLLASLAPSLAVATRPAHESGDAERSATIQSPKRTVFTVTSEAIVTLDEAFIIREINPAFTTILGWSESAAVGHHCSEVWRCRDERRMLLCGTPRCPLHEAFSGNTESPVRELTWETQSGKPTEISASFTVQQVAHHAEAVVVARDVTLLNAANRMRANFISMVSHELRTPLNSVNGFLEIVLESPVGPLNERQREFLNYARVSTQQLTTLVEDIVFMSKADSGQFTLRLARMRVPNVVDSAAQAMQSTAAKAQVKIVTEIPQKLPVVRADELRIQQVLTNLLGNAIKFSPAESVIRLSVSVRETALQVAVSDLGKGIAPEDHARIFERFYQSDANVRTRANGYGLGLSIAKLIIEQHHGRIWVESEPGAGATFYFTLPLAVS